MGRKRLRSIKAIRRELDAVFSRYVRRRDADANGMGQCCTCNKWRKLEASHFIPRQHVSVRWDSRNAHGACSHCNCWLHGNLINYTLYMQKRYGQAVIDELMELKRKTVKFTRADYEAMIERYS